MKNKKLSIHTNDFVCQVKCFGKPDISICKGTKLQTTTNYNDYPMILYFETMKEDAARQREREMAEQLVYTAERKRLREEAEWEVEWEAEKRKREERVKQKEEEQRRTEEEEERIRDLKIQVRTSLFKL